MQCIFWRNSQSIFQLYSLQIKLSKNLSSRHLNMNVYSSISDHDVTNDHVCDHDVSRASVDNPSVSVEIYSPGPVGHSGPRHANGPINSLMEH